MAPKLPFHLRLNLIVPADVPVLALWRFVREALVAQPGFQPDYWRSWVDRDAGRGVDAGMVKGAPPDDAVAARGEANFALGFEVRGKRGGLSVQRLGHYTADQPDDTFGITEGWRLFDLTSAYENDPAAYLAMVAQHMAILKAALARFDVRRADLRRVSNTYLGPMPPLADPEAIAMLAFTDEVAMAYADADAFWGKWDRVEYLGQGKALCTRALEVTDETAFKARTLADGFDLGRAARPGATQYYAADPSSAEQAMLDDMPRYLTQVGYDAAAQSLEFTAVVPEGEHLTPADILDLLAYRDFGTGDGQPVETLIVTFPDEAMARAEAAPLRDIGARIQFFGEGGTWQTLD